MAFREMALRRLQISIMAHEDEINRALRLDLGKSASEAYMCETGMVLAEISYMLKHMRQFGDIADDTVSADVLADGEAERGCRVLKDG